MNPHAAPVAQTKPARNDIQPTSLRDATPGDIDALASIWVEGWNDAHSQILPPELSRFRTLCDLRDRLAGNIANTIVAVSEGRPVGFAMVKKDELDQLYVSRDARGTGAAAFLISDALNRIARAGYRRAWLACAIGNLRAESFYVKSGWSREGIVTIQLDTPAGLIALDVCRFEIAL